MVDDGTDLSGQCGGRFVEPVLGPQENDLLGPVGEECEERVEVLLREVRAEFPPVVDDRYPGLDGDNVCTVADVLSGKVNIEGKRVAVIGSGLTGLEAAWNL